MKQAAYDYFDFDNEMGFLKPKDGVFCYIANFYWAIIKDTLEGENSFDSSGKTQSLYENCFRWGLENSKHILKTLKGHHSYDLIQEALKLNPSKDTPLKPWHDAMRDYVAKNILPPDVKDYPAFIKKFNTAYKGMPRTTEATLGDEFITDETRYAARMPSTSNLNRLNIPGLKLSETLYKHADDNGKEKDKANGKVVSFPIKNAPNLLPAFAVMRSKAESMAELSNKNNTSSSNAWVDMADEERNNLVNERLEDITAAAQCPETTAHIIYNMRGKASALALTQQIDEHTTNISYVCSIKKGASKNLWRHLLQNKELTRITANNVTNPISQNYYKHIGLEAPIPPDTSDANMLVLEGQSLENVRKNLGLLP